MATKYRKAPEVQMIAGKLVREFPELLGHLGGMRVDYHWRDKAQDKNGKTVLGTATLVSGKNALRAHPAVVGTEEWVEGAAHAYFEIEIAFDQWKYLSECQRKALVFHELLHCGEDDQGNPMLLPHDVEEFGAVAEHFGLWKGDVERFAASLQRHLKPTLPFGEDDVERSVADMRGLLRDAGATVEVRR